MSDTRIKAEFDLAPDILHFNNAGIGPWPKKTMDAVCAFARENAVYGTLHSSRWDRLVKQLREQLTALLGAQSSSEIALTKNTSEGLSMVAAGIDWQPGDNVVVGTDEFPSNRLVWESLTERSDVEVRLADFSAGRCEESLLARMDKNTRLLACSSIQYTTGYKMDLEMLGKHCRENDSLFCVDAIQSLGAVPFDVQACSADFVCADGHKWLLSPEGTGIFYCKAEHIKRLKLSQYGWHATARPAEYEQQDGTLAESARRFECGSLNHLGLYALHASLDFMFELGMDYIFKEIIKKTSYLIDNIDKNAYQIVTHKAPEKRGGIVTVKHNHCDNDDLSKYLSGNKILHAKRAGGIRLSPHFYTPQEDLDSLLEHLHTFK